MRQLFDEIEFNDQVSASTLGGNYCPKWKGYSRHIGNALYDPDCGVTVMSQKLLLDQDRIEQIDKYTLFVNFPSLNNFRLKFTYVDGVLASDITPLLREIEEQRGIIHSMLKDNTVANRVGAHWTLTDLDPPSNILQMYKMIPQLTKAQIHRLDCVHHAVRAMWSPSKEDFKQRIHDEFGSVNFSVDDVELYYQLFPDINAIKGKTQLPEIHRRSNLPMMLPNQVLLSCDVMHVAGAKYLIGIINSPKENETIGNIFLEEISDTSSREVTAAVISIGQHVQQVLGFHIKIEFDKDKAIEFSKHIIETELNCHVEQVSGHVDYAEAAIKMIKQRVRVKNSSLVYDTNATVLLHTVIGSVLIINRTIRKGNGKRSAYKVLNPHRKTNFKCFYSFSPSDLVEVTTHSSNSTQHLRTTTAIPLHPSINDNNDWDFYSLETGNIFTRDYKLARKVPWTYEARLRMKYLASLDPISADDEIGVDATPTIPIERYEMPKRFRPINRRRRHNRQGEMLGPEPENDNVVNVCLASSFQESAEFTCDYDEHLFMGSQVIPETPPNLGVYPITDYSVATETKVEDTRGLLLTTMMSPSELLKMDDDGNEIRVMTSHLPQGIILSTYNNHEFCVDDTATSVMTYTGCKEGIIYATQVSARKAYETFGEKGVQAIEKEISSLLSKKVFSAVLKSSLSDTQRKKIIRMSCFVRDKIDAQGKLLKIKARLVAGGHLQDKSIYSPHEISSPTVSISSVFSIISSGISEGRKFLKFDISTAYLNASMPENDDVYMTLDKQMSDLLIKCDESNEFRDKVDDRGQCTVKLEKALYGCVQSARLWYNYLSEFLKSIGFEANPVDPCVFNRKSSSGKQCTLAIHVDDGLATCEDLEELKLLDQQIKQKFNNEVDSEVGCTNFDYLGMLVQVDPGNDATLTMQSYITETSKEHGVEGVAATPATENLFKIDEDAEVLSKTAKEKFHRAVAQLLYLSTRVRPDILLPITFLCSRVANPTLEDLDKLTRVMKYLNGTYELGIKLGEYGKDIGITVYADASYAVHPDCKSHGGIVVYNNRGPVYVKCAKQKMVSKSSTEAELITLSDAVSLAAYNINFLKGQGYDVCAELKQDNTSTIKLAENGRSNSDRTKHIQVRYFFVKQYLDQKVMKISHCPTKEMIADILTKPIQGEQFRILRDMLLGY